MIAEKSIGIGEVLVEGDDARWCIRTDVPQAIVGKLHADFLHVLEREAV